MARPKRILLSRRVRLLAYDHVDDPEGDDVTREHVFAPGVFMYALTDGVVLLERPDGKPLWEEDEEE